ncbi:rac GTPase-activating protein 1 isoform X1 [Tachysurus ichikawai]
MGEEFIRELLTLCLHRLALEQNTHSELELIEVVRNFEVVRKKWLHAELELKKYKELLVKSDVARAALEVKLKHARNQVDVEIKKRYKVEADYQYLERQMLLMTEILAQDTKTNACLNEEQRNMLANFHHRGANITQQRGKRYQSKMLSGTLVLFPGAELPPPFYQDHYCQDQVKNKCPLRNKLRNTA